MIPAFLPGLVDREIDLYLSFFRSFDLTQTISVHLFLVKSFFVLSFSFRLSPTLPLALLFLFCFLPFSPDLSQLSLSILWSRLSFSLCIRHSFSLSFFQSLCGTPPPLSLSLSAYPSFIFSPLSLSFSVTYHLTFLPSTQVPTCVRVHVFVSRILIHLSSASLTEGQVIFEYHAGRERARGGERADRVRERRWESEREEVCREKGGEREREELSERGRSLAYVYSLIFLLLFCFLNYV